MKINCLAGRSFLDDADLQAPCVEWQESDHTTRPSPATDVTPASRLVEEVAKGYLSRGQRNAHTREPVGDRSGFS